VALKDHLLITQIQPTMACTCTNYPATTTLHQMYGQELYHILSRTKERLELWYNVIDTCHSPCMYCAVIAILTND
jgi:hypothetical protein